MMRLVKVELRRLFSRRLTSIALLGALAFTGLMLFDAYQQAKPLSSQQLAFQKTQFNQAHQSWEANGVQQYKECLKQQAVVQKSDPKANLRCNEMEPKWTTWGKPKVKFADLMHSVLLNWSYLIALIGYLIGAGFVAAEFSSGSIGNWLTFEPRRMRVYASKLVAAGVGLIPATVALIGLLFGGVWLITANYGSAAGTTAKMWSDLGFMAGRSITLAVVAAIVGAALGTLLRHTAAVIGIAMGYLVLVEAIFSHSLQNMQLWFLRINMEGWLQHGTKYFLTTCKTDSQGNYRCDGVEKLLGFGHSATYLGLLVVFVVGLSAIVFQRRDVN
jgi:ABC-2 type transport system permease protein